MHAATVPAVTDLYAVMAGVARSTTVIPPTFESLVSSANTIFVGEVMTCAPSGSPTPQGRAIKTHVTFRVEEVWKGAVGAVTQLEFLGGTIGEHDDGSRRHADVPRRTAQRAVRVGRSPHRQPAGRLLARPHARRARSERRRSRAHLRRPIARQPGRSRRAARSNYMLSVTPMRLADLASAVRGRVLAGRAR